MHWFVNNSSFSAIFRTKTINCLDHRRQLRILICRLDTKMTCLRKDVIEFQPPLWKKKTIEHWTTLQSKSVTLWSVRKHHDAVLSVQLSSAVSIPAGNDLSSTSSSNSFFCSSFGPILNVDLSRDFKLWVKRCILYNVDYLWKILTWKKCLFQISP